nr:MAG: hypothetical protein CSA54_01435 [Gammaproteobacteria bacterium]
MFPELHETFILRELVALERRGLRFDIFSLQHPRDPITLEDAKRLSAERTHYSSLFTPATLSAFFRTLVRHPLRLLAAVGKVIRIGRDRPAEVVKNLAILPLALHVGEIGRARGVTHWHGHWANIPTTACWYLQQIHGDTWSAAIHGEDIFTHNRFLARKLDDASFSVVCSGYFCRHLQNEIGLAAPEKVHLNYHGLDPRVMERAAQPSDGTERSEVLELVSIGRLVPTKGHDVVLAACASLKAAGIDVHLTLIGSGPLDAELREEALRLGIRESVSFAGALGFEEVLSILEAGDAFCLAPRLLPGQPPDGIPNVIAEAMALGVPVVTTRVSAIPELVEDGVSGCLVEVDDVAAFADRLRRLAVDRELVATLSSGAREKVAKLFDQKANIDELLDYFEIHRPGLVASITDAAPGAVTTADSSPQRVGTA